MPAVSLLIALHVGQGANVILTTKGIDDMCLKYFVEVPLRRWPPCDCGVHPRWEPSLNRRISVLDRFRPKAADTIPPFTWQASGEWMPVRSAAPWRYGAAMPRARVANRVLVAMHCRSASDFVG